MNMDMVVHKDQIQPFSRDEVTNLLAHTSPDER